MFQDALVPRREAMLRRQDTVAVTLSTSTTPTSSSSAAGSITPAPNADSSPSTSSSGSSAAFSVWTDGYSVANLGDDVCTAALPSGGFIRFNDSYTLVLEESVAYIATYADCANYSIFEGANSSQMGNSTVVPGGDPFFASLLPQVYALAAATVISYILMILIFITPRTFYVGGPGVTGGSMGSGGRFRTFLPGSSGRNSSVIGVGSRPLLQKIAAFTVALSLTIATEKTFSVAEKQYNAGFMDASSLVYDVVNSLEISIIRVISDTFLWLAQVQTLIRLFPRHKEKVTIKWLGFAMVLCDTVFSALENYVSQPVFPSPVTARPVRFTDAIPALSYLFELAIGLIYASCVLYYSLSKRRFAFWHAKMRNVCLVALLSLIAVMIPVVFFITDVADPRIATWGEYIRWVGAAAASVVVWEWVERIEALERDEKKDGILGREIFDGDDMLDLTPSEDEYNPDRPSNSRQNKTKRLRIWKNVRDLNVNIQPKIPLKKWRKGIRQGDREKSTVSVSDEVTHLGTNQISRPPQAITPISRSDTNSAASTVYAVRYHDPFSPSPAIQEDIIGEQIEPQPEFDRPKTISEETTLANSTSTMMDKPDDFQTGFVPAVPTSRHIWQNVSNPFKRKRTEPPAEVAAQIADSNARRSPMDAHLNIRSRLNAFTAAQKGKLRDSHRKKTPLQVTVIPARPRESVRPGPSNPGLDNTRDDQNTSDAGGSDSAQGSPNLASLPVTVIPAPVRGGRTWSPDDMKDVEDNPTASNEEVSGDQPQQNLTQPASLTPLSQRPATVHTQRGALTISESPGRIRESHTPSSGTPLALRRPRNSRSGTMGSIGDRIDGGSPATVSGISAPRSGTTDSTGSRSATTDGAGRQPRVG